VIDLFVAFPFVSAIIISAAMSLEYGYHWFSSEPGRRWLSAVIWSLKIVVHVSLSIKGLR
jgi:hypothetical protein